MLKSKAYKTYYTFASGEKTPKPKYVRKKADYDISLKQMPIQATKGTKIKTKAKVAKFDKKKQHEKMPKAEALDILSKSKVLDEHQQKTSGTNKGTGTIPGVLDVPIYDPKSDIESWGDSDEEDDDEDDSEDDIDNNVDDSNDNDDERMESDRDEIPDPNLTNVDHIKHEKEDVDERVHTPSDYELTDDEKIHDEENINEEEEDEVTKELYDDVNVNLGNKDTKMTNADQGVSEQQNASQQSGFKQEEEDAHVIPTPILDTHKTRGPTQSSSVSSDFTSKVLNLDNSSPAKNEIASLMDTISHHAIVIPKIASSFTITTPPPLPFFNPLS
nr:hypothetical protein [Tanacetum cinerariifolium]